MSPRGWNVNSAILLGSAHPVHCAPRLVYSVLLVWINAVKDSSTAFAWKAMNCRPPPDSALPVFYLLMNARSQADWSNEQSRSAQNCSRKLEVTDYPCDSASRLGLLASICQSTTRNQVMTRLENIIISNLYCWHAKTRKHQEMQSNDDLQPFFGLIASTVER